MVGANIVHILLSARHKIQITSTKISTHLFLTFWLSVWVSLGQPEQQQAKKDEHLEDGARRAPRLLANDDWAKSLDSEGMARYGPWCPMVTWEGRDPHLTHMCLCFSVLIAYMTLLGADHMCLCFRVLITCDTDCI